MCRWGGLWGGCCGGRLRCGGEFGEQGGEGPGSEGFAGPVEVVDAEVAEVFDVGAELVGRGGHEVILLGGDGWVRDPHLRIEMWGTRFV